MSALVPSKSSKMHAKTPQLAVLYLLFVCTGCTVSVTIRKCLAMKL